MDKGNTATSVNRRLSALRSLYRFAIKRGLVEHDPAHLVKGPKPKKPLPYFLKESEMNRLLDDNMWTADYKGLLARTLIIVFYETGIRLSELTGLRVDDVSLINNELKVTGKRSKQRIVPFGDELRKQVETYLAERESRVTSSTDVLFVDESGLPLDNARVRKIVQGSLSRVTTMKKKSPHVLRHTFATAMLNHRAGLESVKQLLGHESVSTTEIYTHTTFEQLKEQYKTAHPRA